MPHILFSITERKWKKTWSPVFQTGEWDHKCKVIKHKTALKTFLHVTVIQMNTEEMFQLFLQRKCQARWIKKLINQLICTGSFGTNIISIRNKAVFDTKLTWQSKKIKLLAISIKMMTKHPRKIDGQMDARAWDWHTNLITVSKSKMDFQRPFHWAERSVFAWVNIMLDHCKQNVSCVSWLPTICSLGYQNCLSDQVVCSFPYSCCKYKFTYTTSQRFGNIYCFLCIFMPL